MTWKRCCLMVIIAFHLSSTTAQSSIDDAKNALKDFSFQVDDIGQFVSSTAGYDWDKVVKKNLIVLTDYLDEDTESFTTLKSNITPFAINVVGGTECLAVLNVSLDLEEYIEEALITESQVFLGLQSLAVEEIEYYRNLSDGLQAQFDRNCVKDNVNCEAVSSFIVAEVDRLIPLVRRVSYAINSETYVLDYKLAVKVELVQSKIITEYKAALQNATGCLALRIKYGEYNLTETSVMEDDPIWKAFLELQRDVDTSYIENLGELLSYMIDSMFRGQKDYLTTNRNIRNAVFTANQTINNLLRIANILQVDADCSLPDLESFINSSLSRALVEYGQYIDVISSKYTEGASQMKDVIEELASIALEEAGCASENATCQYLSEKITRKGQEMPARMQKLANAKSVVMYQEVGAIWESGVHVVRDVLEQLEVRIDGLKSCLHLSLF